MPYERHCAYFTSAYAPPADVSGPTAGLFRSKMTQTGDQVAPPRCIGPGNMVGPRGAWDPRAFHKVAAVRMGLKSLALRNA
jgi:hypothetical protein